MEVHTHTHTPRKKWSHYFWEFLMLFLAVFCGFLAEYQLEHKIERDREKKFIHSYIEDLKTDTANISSNILLRSKKIQTLDSLIVYLNLADPNQKSQQIYLFARQLTRTNRFISSDRTIRQLKAGNFRLIRKQAASDSMQTYDELLERFYYFQDRQTNEILSVSPLMGKLLDPNVLESMIDGQTIKAPSGNPSLRSTERDLLLDFLYNVHQLKTSDIYMIQVLQSMKTLGTNIILFLQKVYHF